MSAMILDGKAVATRIKNQIRAEVEKLKERGITPGLAVVLVGEDPASQIYVRNKEKNCQELGISSIIHRLPATVSRKELLEVVNQLNNDPKINGLLVQLPLPGDLLEKEVIDLIKPEKDVDGFHPVNLGRLLRGEEGMIPCTPAGIMELIGESGVTIEGKECVVVGRSNIVGKPQFHLLLQAHGTVTVCHSRTRNLEEFTRRADILVVAVGQAGLITGSMIKPGAIVIDVGMNRLTSGKLVGDVDFDSARGIAGAITPVPGGVGPMTIAMLMKNTLKATLIQHQQTFVKD